MSLADLNDAETKCTFVGEILTLLLDIRTQWVPLSADIEKRSNAEADDGTLRRRRTEPPACLNEAAVRHAADAGQQAGWWGMWLVDGSPVLQ